MPSCCWSNAAVSVAVVVSTAIAVAVAVAANVAVAVAAVVAVTVAIVTTPVFAKKVLFVCHCRLSSITAPFLQLLATVGMF